MRRYVVSSWSENVNSITVEGEPVKHILTVCRNGVGDQVELLPGNGIAYKVEITEILKDKFNCKIISERSLPLHKKPYLNLVLSVPKFSKLELILEKSVELGVHSIQPVFSDNSHLKDRTRISPSKLKRWNKIMDQAVQQSGQGERTTLKNPVFLDDLIPQINQKSGVMGLFLYEGEGLDVNSSLNKEPSPKEIWYFIGSEGGFSRRERSVFLENGFEAVSLGDAILRVETACLAVPILLKYRYELW